VHLTRLLLPIEQIDEIPTELLAGQRPAEAVSDAEGKAVYSQTPGQWQNLSPAPQRLNRLQLAPNHRYGIRVDAADVPEPRRTVRRKEREQLVGGLARRGVLRSQLARPRRGRSVGFSISPDPPTILDRD